MRILVVEDDAVLREVMLRSLCDAGHRVDTAATAADARHLWRVQPFDVVLLDLNLPDGSGLNVLRDARARNDRTPVLVLTARNRTDERIAGLDAGADDYLVKPFALDELHARVRALIRRRNAASSSIIEHGKLSFDLTSRQAAAAGVPLELSVREAGILEVLLLRAGRAVTKEQLLEKLCAWDSDISLNAIEVYVHRLRKKLEPAGVQVRTFRGLGYCIDKARPVEQA